jgi:hypothetical protein
VTGGDRLMPVEVALDVRLVRELGGGPGAAVAAVRPMLVEVALSEPVVAVELVEVCSGDVVARARRLTQRSDRYPA